MVLTDLEEVSKCSDGKTKTQTPFRKLIPSLFSSTSGHLHITVQITLRCQLSSKWQQGQAVLRVCTELFKSYCLPVVLRMTNQNISPLIIKYGELLSPLHESTGGMTGTYAIAHSPGAYFYLQIPFSLQVWIKSFVRFHFWQGFYGEENGRSETTFPQPYSIKCYS